VQGGKGADRGWWPLVAVCLAVFLLLLDVTRVTVALPQIGRDLGVQLEGLQWVVNGYALSLAALQLTAGSLGDRLGTRNVFVAGLVVFAVGSLACGLSGTAWALIAARVVQGVGGAIMFSTSLAIVGECYRGSARGLAFGIRGGIAGVAVSLGPLLGGVLTSGLGWRWNFFLNLPIAAVAVAIALAKLPRPARPAAGRRLDVAGPVVFCAALVLLVSALLQANDRGWTSPPILGGFAAGALLLVVFVFVERRHPDPMLDVSLFRDRSFTGAQLAALAAQGSLFPLFVFLPLYLQNLLGFSALEAGLRLLPITIPVLLVGPVAGQLSDRFAPRNLLALGLVVTGAGLFLMRALGPSSGWTTLLPGFVAAGAGIGCALPPLAQLAVSVAGPSRIGMASGTNNTFQQLGLVAGISAYFAIFQHHIATRLAQSAPPEADTPALAGAVAAGAIRPVLAQLPPGIARAFGRLAREAFVGGLDALFLVGACVALAGAVLTVALIRSKDPEQKAGKEQAQA
jgi:EmrB/QacA subfamily drug resistance transporter